MRTTRFILALVILSLLVAVVPALAQEPTFGLSDADYALLTDANGMSSDSEAVSYTFVSTIGTTGVPADEGGDLNISLNGTGTVNTADAENPVFSMVLTGDMVSGGETTPINLELRVIGNMLYINNNNEGWQGSTLDELMSQATGMAGVTGEELPVDPEELASGDLSELEDMMGMEGMGDAVMALATLDPETFVSMTRLADANGLAHFIVDVSIADLLGSPAVAPMIGAAMGGAMGGSTGGTETQMTEEQLQQMSSMFSQMFEDATITVDQYVDTATSYVEQTVLDVSIPLLGLVGMPITFGINFDIDLMDYGVIVPVEVPADVEMMS
jgi:hypothetical protein